MGDIDPALIALHAAAAPSCTTCGSRRILMIAMKPGNDGKEWWLCPRCYEDGLRKMNGELNIVTADLPRVETVPASRGKPKAAKPAVRDAEPSRSTAKDEAGSFDRHPNAPDRGGLYFDGGIQYVPDDDGYW